LCLERFDVPLEFKLDIEAAGNRIGKMLNTLQTVPVPDELTLWQTEDMHRKRPDTEILNQTAARTRIYPRGRRVLVRKTIGTLIKKPRVVRRRAVATPGQRRPILRPELYDKLCARMNDMMRRFVKW
jgi:hypothetical protein